MVTASEPVTAEPGPLAAHSGLGAEMLQLDKQLCFALYASSLAMTKLYKPVLAPLGLTYPQYLVMLVLWEQAGSGQAPLSVNHLGARLSLDSGTLTPLLKRLAAAGLLQRQRDAADERRVHLVLTQAGLALREQALLVPAQVACASGCEISELVALTARLHRLRQNLEQHRHPP